jgi:hypothetical protein
MAWPARYSPILAVSGGASTKTGRLLAAGPCLADVSGSSYKNQFVGPCVTTNCSNGMPYYPWLAAKSDNRRPRPLTKEQLSRLVCQSCNSVLLYRWKSRRVQRSGDVHKALLPFARLAHTRREGQLSG